MKFTDEIINEIDGNSVKAIAILKALVLALQEEIDIDTLHLAESALDYLNANNEYFKNRI